MVMFAALDSLLAPKQSRPRVYFRASYHRNDNDNEVYLPETAVRQMTHNEDLGRVELAHCFNLCLRHPKPDRCPASL